MVVGFADEGLELTRAGRIIGTSAGATVGAQLISGLSLEDLFQRQVKADLQSTEIVISPELMIECLGAFQSCAAIADPVERGARLGRIAMEAMTVSETDRRSVIADRLPTHQWPATALELIAVDAESGGLQVFEASGKARLVDAVAASCAIPGIWPPVLIAGRRYIDGGVRSPDNSDLAAGDRSVVILSPVGGASTDGKISSLQAEMMLLDGAGTKAIAFEPDAEARSAMGSNPLDPSIRAAAAQAGRTQGRQDAKRLNCWLKSVE